MINDVRIIGGLCFHRLDTLLNCASTTRYVILRSGRALRPWCREVRVSRQ